MLTVAMDSIQTVSETIVENLRHVSLNTFLFHSHACHCAHRFLRPHFVGFIHYGFIRLTTSDIACSAVAVRCRQRAHPSDLPLESSQTRSLTSLPSRNRSLSVRSKKGGSSVSEKQPSKHRFTMASLRGTQQPELSKKLYKIIKTENHVIGAHEAAAREQVSVARQLSEWGEATEDETISEVSDKLGVLLAEIAEQEDLYAQALEDYRGVLKQIRNTESSVQPSRDQKAKVRLQTYLSALLADTTLDFGRDRQVEVQGASEHQDRPARTRACTRRGAKPGRGGAAHQHSKY